MAILQEIATENEHYNSRCERITATATATQGVSYPLENAYLEHMEALEEIKSRYSDLISAYILNRMYAS